MEELKDIRKEITETDNELAKLFCRRMQLVKKVAEYKKANGLPIFDPQREAAVLENGASRVEDDELKGYYVSFLKSAMEISRRYQSSILEGLKVAYCGTKGAFAHIASSHLFPTARLIAYPSFKKAYEAVENGECECAVLPVENSFAGDVGQVNDLMFSGPLHINGMYDLAVTHDLLGVKGSDLSSIKTVVSHPQALSQCSAFIKDNALSEQEYSNTALAAEFVKNSNDTSVAAIASAESAKIFGLEVIARSINDDRSNTTRFAVFSRADSKATGNMDDPHFSLVFTAKNEAGSLAKAISIIGKYGFNMKTLRSRPNKELLWQYYFYVEAEGDIYSKLGQLCLEELKDYCDKIKIVGSYNNLHAQEA